MIWTCWPRDSWHLTNPPVNDVYAGNKCFQAVVYSTALRLECMRRTAPLPMDENTCRQRGQEWLRDKKREADGRILPPLLMILPIRSSSHYPWLLTLFQSWRIWWDICFSRRGGLTEESPQVFFFFFFCPSSFKSPHLTSGCHGISGEANKFWRPCTACCQKYYGSTVMGRWRCTYV